MNQLKHKQLPPQRVFAIFQNNFSKPVHHLIQNEETLPQQKHDFHPILADFGRDQFSIRINDNGNDIFVTPLDSFSFKSKIPFQKKYKTLAKIQQNLYINNLYS